MLKINKNHPLYSVLKAMNKDEYSEPLIEESSSGEVIIYTGLVIKDRKYTPGNSNQIKGK